MICANHGIEHLPDDPETAIWLRCPRCGGKAMQLTRRPGLREAFACTLVVGATFGQKIPGCRSCGRFSPGGDFRSDDVIVEKSVT